MTDTVVFLNISHHIPVAGRHGMQTTVFSVKIGHFALTTTLSTNLSVRFWDATTTSRYLRFLFSSRGHLKCLKEQPMLFPPVRRSLCVCFDNRVETIDPSLEVCLASHSLLPPVTLLLIVLKRRRIPQREFSNRSAGRQTRGTIREPLSIQRDADPVMFCCRTPSLLLRRGAVAGDKRDCSRSMVLSLNSCPWPD